GTVYSDDYEGYMTEWTQAITFTNGASPYEVRSNGYEIYLSTISPYNAFQLNPSLYNDDGSTVSKTFSYFSENTAVATVSSTGAVVAISTGLPSVSKVDMMAQTTSGSDLLCTPSFNCTQNGEYQSATHPFQADQQGDMITIVGSNGWVAGTYYISSINPANQI